MTAATPTTAPDLETAEMLAVVTAGLRAVTAAAAEQPDGWTEMHLRIDVPAVAAATTEATR